MNFIVPLDFSENSINALEFGLTMASRKQGKITLVHVVDMAYDFASQSAIALDSVYQESNRQLQSYVDQYKSPDIEIDYVVIAGNMAISVARIAEERNANLILMGTQGASGISKTLIGTNAVNMIREATCPVLIVPAQAQVAEIRKVTLALEFANHEEPFIDWIVAMSNRWDLNLEILHIKIHRDFKDELAVLGLEEYLGNKYPDEMIKIHTFYAENASDGLVRYMEEHSNMILVMCRQHRNLWDQILQKSESIRLAYHTHVPLLIMQ
ncbi:hypothetical protein GCM10009119_27470 [Algoriphagus jejuensis]|uniref:UspA domain-containing protein n=1 Tax=Algoriphagus jejuensis TaxID=419934 RepID=A0ABN1N1U0_9BACT